MKEAKIRVFYIYKITNTVNGSFYIGRSVNPVNRFKSHMWRALSNNPKYNDCEKFYNSIRCHGKEAFSQPEILAIVYSQEDAFTMEEAFIKSLDAVDCGLNCTYGSEGGMAGYEYSDASKKKM